MGYVSSSIWIKNLISIVDTYPCAFTQFFLGRTGSTDKIGRNVKTKNGDNGAEIEEMFETCMGIAEREDDVKFIRVVVSDSSKRVLAEKRLDLSKDEYLNGAISPKNGLRTAPPTEVVQQGKPRSLGSDLYQVLAAQALGAFGMNASALGNIEDNVPAALGALSEFNAKVLERNMTAERNKEELDKAREERTALLAKVAEMERQIEKYEGQMAKLEETNANLQEQITRLDPDKSLLGVSMKSVLSGVATNLISGMANTPLGQNVLRSLSGGLQENMDEKAETEPLPDPEVEIEPGE